MTAVAVPLALVEVGGVPTAERGPAEAAAAARADPPEDAAGPMLPRSGDRLRECAPPVGAVDVEPPDVDVTLGVVGTEGAAPGELVNGA